MTHIVLVHGAWHGPWCWKQVAASLAEKGHTTDCVQLPGHDRPGTTSRIWNRISQYVGAVSDAVERSPEPPILVGHSMGGYTTQRYLERRSDRVAAGVLVASVPRRGTLPVNLRIVREHPVMALRATLTADYFPLVATNELVRDLFFSPDTPSDIVTDCQTRLQNESALAVNTMNVRWPRPKRVSAPVHVIGAEGDGVFTVAEQHDLAAAYGTEAVMLDGGHDLMLDTTWPSLVDAIDRIATDTTPA